MTRVAAPVHHTGQSSALQVNHLTSIEAVNSFRTEWQALRDIVYPDSVHSDIDWFLSFTQPSINLPHVLAFKKHGALVAIIAGYIYDRLVPFKLGYFKLGQFKAPAFSTTYQCCMIHPDFIELDSLREILCKELKKDALSFMYINALPIESQLYNVLRKPQFLKSMTLAYPPEPHMTMRLENTLEKTITAKGSSVRAYLKRTNRKIDLSAKNSEYMMRCFKTKNELDTYFEHAEVVAKKSYQRALGVGFKLTDQHFRQAEIAANRGWFRGYVLYKNTIPVAFEEDYVCNGHCFNPYVGYNQDYRQSSIGTVLMVNAWKEMITNANAKVYDFGFGDGEYKRRFFDESVKEGELLILSITVKNFFIHTLLSLNLGIDSMIKKTMKSLGVYNVIKRVWRQRRARGQVITQTVKFSAKQG
jgi:hypothetical protein